ncbi:NAD-dependent epimerase/dehydratase family protein [Roseivivax isoporae]|uniref:NAD-dependent epimerase/dehydratase domain-containing protein n=1 Tax=Roseivivax isoporae LMG 25204 TaxID=1449351 RepID=X7F4N2_9RHOB|nr:NAD(P)-dependent oxidoreductase [Roseivivax isoporae]ETX27780.1 hypothetical protein RISW2_11305 [Roseivivax isoporae LMG 25204]
MGPLGRIVVTGAAGFVGRAVVAEARRRGHPVVAVVRGAPVADWSRDAGIEPCRCDLADPGAAAVLARACRGADAVIHAAAHLDAGVDAARETAAGTAHLLAAMAEAGTRRLVLVSSIAVYDTAALAPGSAITEATPVEREGAARDGYVAQKLAQERMARAAAEAGGPGVWILRVGAIYGAGRLWNAHLGVRVGPVLIRVGTGGEVPVAHLALVARALVDASARDPAGERVLNVTDDVRPDRDAYLHALRRSGWPSVVVPLPWTLWLAAARLLRPLEPRLPGLLRARILRARMLPFRYPNTALRRTFGGAQARAFEDRFAQAIAEGGG